MQWYTATFKVTSGSPGPSPPPSDDYAPAAPDGTQRRGGGQGANAKLAAALLGAVGKRKGSAAAALAATLTATAAECGVADIRNPIHAQAFECTQLESGTQLASVGCPSGMTAVNIGCALFASGTFIPALGATGIVVGDTASCAFPPRDNVEPEWAAYPYALILNCAYLDVNAQPLAKARAAERLYDAVEGFAAHGGGSTGPPGKGKGWREAAAASEPPVFVSDAPPPSRPSRSSRARRGLLRLGGLDDGGDAGSSSDSGDL